MSVRSCVVLLLVSIGALAAVTRGASGGPYDPQVGQTGCKAIAKDDARIVAWATGFKGETRGPINITDPAGPKASFGAGKRAAGPATGTVGDVISLGDGGHITMTFAKPIRDGAGPDLVVFENGFITMAPTAFLELAFVEVSSDGKTFVRFPAVSLTETSSQVSDSGSLDASDLHNLAGKHIAGHGTPFDLSDLRSQKGAEALDFNHIRFVRVVDVVGTIDPKFGTTDSKGNLINEPYPTEFDKSGFDLEAVGVINQ